MVRKPSAFPKGRSPGPSSKLRNLGVPHLEGRARGDLYVHVDVQVPKKLTREQRRMFEELLGGCLSTMRRTRRACSNGCATFSGKAVRGEAGAIEKPAGPKVYDLPFGTACIALCGPLRMIAGKHMATDRY